MSLMDSSKDLQQLENLDWGEPIYDSVVDGRAHQLRRIPLRALALDDVRFLVTHKIGVPWILPLALEALQGQPLLQASYYPGDLLKSVVQLEDAYLKSLRIQVHLIRDLIGAIPDERFEALNCPPEVLDSVKLFLERELFVDPSAPPSPGEVRDRWQQHMRMLKHPVQTGERASRRKRV